jgi:hypothetical protein
MDVDMSLIQQGLASADGTMKIRLCSLPGAL